MKRQPATQTLRSKFVHLVESIRNHKLRPARTNKQTPGPKRPQSLPATTPGSHPHDAVSMACTSVNDIEFLTSREEFRRFMSVLEDMESSLAREVLEAEMDDKEREARRNFRLGILEAIKAPDEIRRRNTELLHQYRSARHLLSPHFQDRADGGMPPAGKVFLSH